MRRLGLLCLLISVGAGGCTQAQPESSVPQASATPGVVQLSADALANANIVVQDVAAVARTEQIVAPGLLTLDETRTARVGSLQEGLILVTEAQVGDRVRPQQLLARMHGHALHDAWAGYRKALAERRRAENQLAFSAEAHERVKRLFADKAVALQEVQRAEVDRVAAAQAVNTAKAEVTRSVEELEHVGIKVPASPTPAEEDKIAADGASEQIPVRSPMGGVVLERLVTPGTTVTPGAPLFVVSDLSTLWAVAEVDESLLSRVRVGRPVEVLVAAYPDERFQGTITFVADTVNPKTRRITVRSTVPNQQFKLKPEMFATVSLGEGTGSRQIVVPNTAVQTVNGAQVVFVETGQGRFEVRTIATGTEGGGQLAVTSGLAEGERIAVEGSFVLKSELLKTASAGD